MSHYRADLAYIHDTGFRDYALAEAPGLLAILRRHRIRGGLVVDLGCGSGHWCAELCRHGYDAAGIDSSPQLLRIARRRTPAAAFHLGSLWNAALPPCAAVTSLGECINYAGAPRTSLPQLFRRVRRALLPGGLWIFDAATPDRIPANGTRIAWREGPGWAVISETTGRGRTLVRRIVTWRRAGARYRRSEEAHRLLLYSPEEVLAALRTAGFSAEAVTRIGRFRLPEGIIAYIANPESRTLNS
jgi:SAM-dependent methyltransferase